MLAVRTLRNLLWLLRRCGDYGAPAEHEILVATRPQLAHSSDVATAAAAAAENEMET